MLLTVAHAVVVVVVVVVGGGGVVTLLVLLLLMLLFVVVVCLFNCLLVWLVWLVSWLFGRLVGCFDLFV